MSDRPFLVYLFSGIYGLIRYWEIGYINVFSDAKIAVDIVIGICVAIYTALKCIELAARIWAAHKKRKENGGY